MARRIVTAADVEALPPAGELVMPADAIITDRAREVATERGVRFRTGSDSPESAIPGREPGVFGPEFGIRNPESGKKRSVVALGADHGGYELKEYLKQFLTQSGYDVKDLGTDSTAAVDYPDFAQSVAQAVASGAAWRGIVIDAVGVGSAIAANKVHGIRAALCPDRGTARNSREHNDANVLTLGARMLRPEEAREIAAVWLQTKFGGGRHQRRVDKIIALEPPGKASVSPGRSAGILLATEDEQQRQSLIEAITSEVVSQLGDKQRCELRGLEIDAVVCPGCDGRCVENCPTKARQVMAAGAERLSAGQGVSQIPADLAALIDHTLLKPDASEAEVRKLCEEARQFGFATVCVNPAWVAFAASVLRGTPVKVCAVAGFPLGATLSRVKAFEAEQVVRLGAQEVDMVISVGALKSGHYERVEQDIRSVAEAGHQGGAICKVILECALLTDQEKVIACRLSRSAGADFVKTSTGFGPGGATAKDVELMRLVVGLEMGVKAAGGIRTYEDLKKMLTAGATRIGASASVKIIQEASGVVNPSPPSEPEPASARY